MNLHELLLFATSEDYCKRCYKPSMSCQLCLHELFCIFGELKAIMGFVVIMGFELLE